MDSGRFDGIEVATRLDAARVDQVLALTEAVAAVDGTYPLSEHVVLHLRHGGDADVRHLLAVRDGALAGYAHVDVTDAVAGPSAELAVHPAHRRRGLGRRLVAAAVAVSPDGRLRLWAHGAHPAAAVLAASLGFTEARVLWRMVRPLTDDVAEPRLPPGVRLRPFVPGQDEDAWLVTNARAFASHPEQGRWTRHDLELRMAEPWFDPAGFLLAERVADARLLGFHWTKVHGAAPAAAHSHAPIGEVYVLGVDPDAAGLGLGRALTLAGLRHLRGRGLAEVMLYVDGSNTRAVGLYTALGFTRRSTDVSFVHGRPA